MSKSLITLLDNALLPASTMVAGKFIGLLLTIRFFNIPFSVNDYSNFLLNITNLLNKKDVTLVAAYSDLIMYISVSLIFGFNITKSFYMNNSHMNPDILLKLKKFNLINLLEGSYEIYHRTFMWFMFTIISNIIILVNFFNNNAFLWIVVLCSISTIVLSFLFFQEVYKEFENIRKHPSKYNWN